MKHLVIMRGLPGSGKSTAAERLIKKFISIYKGAVACKCSADDYFIGDDGMCRFNSDKLGKAHVHCIWKAKTAMGSEIPLVIIDNTNTTAREMRPYIEMAKDFGYKVRYKVVGGTADEDIRLYVFRNVHDVPEESVRRMAIRLNDSLKKKGQNDRRKETHGR